MNELDENQKPDFRELHRRITGLAEDNNVSPEDVAEAIVNIIKFSPETVMDSVETKN